MIMLKFLILCVEFQESPNGLILMLLDISTKNGNFFGCEIEAEHEPGDHAHHQHLSPFFDRDQNWVYHGMLHDNLKHIHDNSK